MPIKRDGRQARSRAAKAAVVDVRHEKMLEVLRQFRVVLGSAKRHYRGVERKCGVSGAQLWALGQIGDRPEISVGELARALAIHQSTASNMLARLQELGLVIRARAGADQRVVRLRLTDKGRGVLRRAPNPFQGVLQQALAAVPAATLQALHRHMTELIRQIRSKDRAAEVTPISLM